MQFIKNRAGNYFNVEKIASLEVEHAGIIAYYDFHIDQPEVKWAYIAIDFYDSKEKAQENLDRIMLEVLLSKFKIINSDEEASCLKHS